MFIRSATAAPHKVSGLKVCWEMNGVEETQFNLFHLLPGYMIFPRLSVTFKKRVLSRNEALRGCERRVISPG